MYRKQGEGYQVKQGKRNGEKKRETEAGEERSACMYVCAVLDRRSSVRSSFGLHVCSPVTESTPLKNKQTNHPKKKNDIMRRCRSKRQREGERKKDASHSLHLFQTFYDKGGGEEKRIDAYVCVCVW